MCLPIRLPANGLLSLTHVFLFLFTKFKLRDAQFARVYIYRFFVHNDFVHNDRTPYIVYLPCWITATVPASAPCHDLNIINSILQFNEINQGAAKNALMGIENHLWYLTEELLPLSLFSSNV